MLFKVFLFALSLVTQLTVSFAQFKLEREYRIDDKDVPTNAVLFIDSLNFNRKIKWFKEEGLKTESIEAKTKYQGSHYSIEFDTAGIIQDVEVEIECSDLSDRLKRTICKNINERYKKYTFVKVQKQYLGTQSQLLTLTTNNISKELTVNYEIVFHVKDKGEHKKIECLFNSKGDLILSREIVKQNTDHLEY